MTTLKNRWFPQFWVIAQIWGFTQIWGIPDGFTQTWVMDQPIGMGYITQIWGKSTAELFPQIWVMNSDLSDELRFEWKNKKQNTYYRPSIHNVIFVVVGKIRIIGDHIQVAIHYLCFFTINAWQFRNCKGGFHHCKLETPSTRSCSCHLSFLSSPSAITKLSPTIRHLNYNINFILHLSL